jgi:hypothetical protein
MSIVYNGQRILLTDSGAETKRSVSAQQRIPRRDDIPGRPNAGLRVTEDHEDDEMVNAGMAAKAKLFSGSH